MADGVNGAPGRNGAGGRDPRRGGLVRRVFSGSVTTVADAIVPAVVDAVDLNEAASRIDVNDLVQQVDVEVLMSKIDIEKIVERINVDRLLEGVDVNALIRRVDIDALLGAVDVNAVLQRVDVDGLMQRVDIDKILSRVDVNALAARVEVGSLVGRGTEGILRSFLDLLRRQVVGLDVIVMRLLGHLTRRRQVSVADGPELLRKHDGRASQVTGRYAGPVSRLVAFAIDVGVVFASFAGGTAVLGYIVQLISGYRLTRSDSVGWSVAFAVWWFLYLWIGLATAGRTVGKALVGLRVVSLDGSPLTQRRALVRVIVFPLSFAFLCVGLLLSLIDPQRRTLHDLAGRTCVVYDWGDRPVELPEPLTWWLSRRGAIDVATPRSAPGA